jgi:outer membrane lipoprotein SlyB
MIHAIRMPRLGVALLAVAAGCSTASPTPSYDAAEVGQPLETTEGQIHASRVVTIAGDTTGTGPFAGAVAGGLLGPLGVLAGAGLGYLTEQRLRGGEGLEYLVETADGRMVTVVQERAGAERPLPAGTPVLVQVGVLSARVVERPAAGRSGAGGATDWVNPDDAPPPAAPWVNPDDTPPPAAPTTGGGREPVPP